MEIRGRKYFRSESSHVPWISLRNKKFRISIVAFLIIYSAGLAIMPVNYKRSIINSQFEFPENIGDNLIAVSKRPGSVEKILADEGARVDFGDVVLEINSDSERHIYKRLINDRTRLIIKIGRLRAQADFESDYTVGQVYFTSDPEYSKLEQDIFYKNFEHVINNLNRLEERIRLENDQIDLLKKAGKSGIDILRHEADILSLKAEMDDVRSDYIKASYKEYETSLEELRDVNSEISEIKRMIVNSRITAPADGIVINLSDLDRGQYVRNREELFGILTDDVGLAATFFIDNGEYRNFKIGDAVDLTIYTSGNEVPVTGNVVDLGSTKILNKNVNFNKFMTVHVDAINLKTVRDAGHKIMLGMSVSVNLSTCNDLINWFDNCMNRAVDSSNL